MKFLPRSDFKGYETMRIMGFFTSATIFGVKRLSFQGGFGKKFGEHFCLSSDLDSRRFLVVPKTQQKLCHDIRQPTILVGEVFQSSPILRVYQS